MIQKTAEATGNLIDNNVADRIRSSAQSNSETITNEHDKEVSKERRISPEQRF